VVAGVEVRSDWWRLRAGSVIPEESTSALSR
jgi:hypothetical protein